MARKVKVTNDSGHELELELPAPVRRGYRAPRPRGLEAFGSRVSIKVTPGELLAWRRLAATQRRSVSAVVRELVNRELERAARKRGAR